VFACDHYFDLTVCGTKASINVVVAKKRDIVTVKNRGTVVDIARRPWEWWRDENRTLLGLSTWLCRRLKIAQVCDCLTGMSRTSAASPWTSTRAKWSPPVPSPSRLLVRRARSAEDAWP